MSFINIPTCSEDCKHKDHIAAKKIAETRCSICGEPCGFELNITRLNGYAHQVCAEVIIDIAPDFQDRKISELEEMLAGFKKELATDKRPVLQEKVDTLTGYIARRKEIETAIRRTVSMHRQEKQLQDIHTDMIKALKGELMEALVLLGRNWQDEEGGYARLTKPTEERITFDRETLDKALPALVLAIASMKEIVGVVIADNLDPDHEGDKETILKMRSALDDLSEVQVQMAAARKVSPPMKPTVQVK